jgi:hypothetical protein
MPRRRSQSTVRGLILGVVAVVLGIGLVLAVSVFASRSDLKNLGDQEFSAGKVDSLSDAIDEDGPLLLPDLSGGKSLDIYLQRIGDGWHAIAAGPRDCTLEWTGDEFREPCTSETFPADGEGRTRYRTRVEDERVYVDFTETLP